MTFASADAGRQPIPGQTHQLGDAVAPRPGRADIGRRFGPDNAIGVRVNVMAREGDAPIKAQSTRESLGSLLFSGGFFIQEEASDSDQNAGTSEGMFVYEGDGDSALLAHGLALEGVDRRAQVVVHLGPAETAIALAHLVPVFLGRTRARFSFGRSENAVDQARVRTQSPSRARSKRYPRAS